MPKDFARQIPTTDRRLGRHIRFDARSAGYQVETEPDRSTWHTKTIRVWDPTPNPNQCHGECTFVAKCVQFNAVGNRRPGQVLDMETAHRGYSLATTLDPFPGKFPPDDTGSSTLAAAKAAQKLGLGGVYRFIFTLADGVVQSVIDGNVVNVGTRWDERMFHRDSRGFIEPGGATAGGHSWTIRGYDLQRDALLGRCWWGDFRDFYIKREHLSDLLEDDGDAHIQARA